MGFLSDTAKNSFRKSQRRVFIPEWMQIAQWGALGIIPVIIFIGFLQPDAAPSSKNNIYSEITPGTVTTDPVQNFEPDTGAKVKLPRSGGGTVSVPEAALAAAKSAGLAIWTAEWDDVPLLGATPTNEASFPLASLGKAVVFTVAEDMVTFSIQLDTEGNGRFEQSFQISVVRENGRWVYPTNEG